MSGERDYLRSVIRSTDEAHKGELGGLVATNSELDATKEAISELTQKLDATTLERDAALKAQNNAGDHALKIQSLKDTLAKREKIILDFRHNYANAELKISHLEDELETITKKLNEVSTEDLKTKLHEKTIQCNQQRYKIKVAEENLKISQERVLKVADEGKTLQGAAHLVIPNANSKMPRTIISCSECYSKNIECDHGARCKNCTDSNTVCARWRCSLKHKLGECPLAPCKLPHDPQGWLVLQEPRPQW